MTEESAVTVCVRVRPLIAREEKVTSENQQPVHHFWKADKKSIHQMEDGVLTKTFNFDRVFTAEETTIQLYQDIAKPLVVSSVEGYNGTIFAYGQTSSGKTFTMMGGGGDLGVIPLAVEDVFETIKKFPKKEFLLRVSYMEIYNETVTDLLVDSWKRKPLDVREAINKTIFVADLTEELVTSPAQALAWIRKGENNRHYGKTEMNQRSSRSHAIFRMILESRERSEASSGENSDGAIIVSHLNLVDLAGSERVSQTGAEGARFKEGCNINRSLFTLGQVIKKLTDESQKGFTNYRDSKLTRILQNSLGGNAKTGIICTITSVELENTLSTLQFASTAKKMKNDPHVTEVSDDGALLKRYRNEITDLKRRLNEVSSVTHTTATEKEVLSQLLQEKEMLQREQEDRIRNLTQLLVTSSNQAPVKRMPKRRRTWGGNTFSLARVSVCDTDSSNLSLLGSVKRKAETRSELCEEDEFDSHWNIPEESPDDLEMSRSVTVRNYEYRNRSVVSPEWTCETSEKDETLREQVSHLQLQVESQQTEEVLLKSQAAELEDLLQTERQLRHQAVEEVQMLELKLADVEQNNVFLSGSEEQTRREFADTIQLCEALASEKDVLVIERDFLKDELQMLADEKQIVEQEKSALCLELRGKKEMEEFEALEEQFRTEQENDLKNEICIMKKALESSAAQCLQLQKQLEEVSVELRRKGDVMEELQRMNGKDLVQEVAKLRRSLDDAEGVSRDTKKEWAHLRSQNMALQENNLTLSSEHQKMESEVNSLRLNLDNGKSLYKKMQNDLQKELNMVFEENTKLTTLLDGKVPKNLMERVDLERVVSSLNQDLSSSRGTEEVLRTKMENLTQQVEKMSEDLQKERLEKDVLTCEADVLRSNVVSITEERDELRVDMQENMDIMIEVQEELRTSLEKNKKQKELLKDLQTSTTSPQLEDLQTQLKSVQAERDALLSERTPGSPVDTDQHQEILEGLRQEKIQLQLQLEDATQEMRSVTEKLQMLESETQCSPEEKQKMSNTIKSLSQERDELHEILEGLRQEKKHLQLQLEDAMEKMQFESLQIFSPEIHPQQLLQKEELMTRIKTLSEERDVLLDHVKTLSEDRNQLQEVLEGLRQEKIQLQLQLKNTSEDLITQMRGVTEKVQMLEAERTSGTEEKEELMTRIKTLSEERDVLKDHVKTLSEERDVLKDQVKTLSEERDVLKDQVKTLSEERDVLKDHVKTLSEERDVLKDHVKTLSEERDVLKDQVKTLSEERDVLKDHVKTLSEERDVLQDHVKTLSEERDVLKDHVKTLSEERDVLKDHVKTFSEERDVLKDHVKTLSEERDVLKTLSEERDVLKTLSEERDVLKDHVKTLSEERDVLKTLSEDRNQLQEVLEGLRQEKIQLQLQLKNTSEDLITQMRGVTEKVQMLEAERTSGTEEKEELMTRIKTLSEDLEGLRQEKIHLQLQLEDAMEKSSSIQETMKECEDMKKQVEHLKEQLRKQDEAEAAQQLLSEAQESRSSVKEMKTMSSRLQTSTEQLQELFAKSQEFMEFASRYDKETLTYNLTDFINLPRAFNVSVPESSMRVYTTMCDAEKPTMDRLLTFATELQRGIMYYRKTFEDLLRMDVEMFEEKRLQDLLVCRSQTPHISITQQDFNTLWEPRLEELLEKRQRYIQKMNSCNYMVSKVLKVFDTELRKELGELNTFTNHLTDLMKEPIDFTKVTHLFITERQRRLEHVARCRDIPLENILSEHRVLSEELKHLQTEADVVLQQEKIRRSTLMQTVEEAPVQTDVFLSRDNQTLTEQLHKAQLKIQTLSSQNESQTRTRREETKLLQTELQSCRRLVEDKENIIQSLKTKISQSETNVPPTVVQLEKVKMDLLQTRSKLSSTCDQHREEIQMMKTLLSEKDSSIRTLKETLRRSQGEDSLLQGEHLHYRLTQSRGLGVKNSILMEKSKLEEEVKRLHVRISEMESSLSSNQDEILRWKSRALNIKEKSEHESERSSPPCTPTKRPRTLIADPPHLNSPKKFFDNSGLRTDPDEFLNKDSWPSSPKFEEMCKTQ